MSLHADAEEIGVTTSDCLADCFVKCLRLLLVPMLLGLRETVVLPVADMLCFNSSGAAIFFEFKHYKPKKRFTSTKCFAFMEMDEIKPGPIVIEL